ncbi:hypothetical protein QRO11_22105 [Paracidovorax citrulli]|uniref:Uncharacterized protein n=2 Tax=Paracidovorax citrulli TaxID=80869 RepID=A1TIM1_PARC0|nr:hypothetical protein [Paracidovorax citrulli]ABM30809.1 conserved hypothetical protein [Paracidovorax citrulli AAC00-1]ATG96010.1 hypothetical protein CQB05_19870 [Paracidovorax citrulli]MVT29769.1 hypothetical protein [Paracidovorax citrulli]MVT37811.1 hypothetical protein [Paracidovorax citrulli]PVY64981.1 hypothetical protein C8E08_2328 [Paracidovorax citrulli]
MNDSPMQKTAEASPDTSEAPIQEARLWSDGRWTAEVIKNEDDDGWAVSMTLRGESEPALVGPWTMGRDKKNPKPLDVTAFHTLVKTASEVLRRHEQQLHAQLHKEVTVGSGADLVRVALRIVPDEEYPYAMLTAHDASGQLLGEARVEANFKLSQGSALAWVESDYSSSGR